MAPALWGYIFRTFRTGETIDLFDVLQSVRIHIKDRWEQTTTSLEGYEDTSMLNSANAQLARWFEALENRRLKLSVSPFHFSGEAWAQTVLFAKS